jgi:hypothetical protein
MSNIRFVLFTCFGVCGIPLAHADKLSDDINSIWDKPGGGLPSMGVTVQPNGSPSVWVILPESIIGSAVGTEQEVTVVEAFLNRWGSRFCSTLFNFQQPHSDMLVTVARETEGPEVTARMSIREPAVPSNTARGHFFRTGIIWENLVINYEPVFDKGHECVKPEDKPSS